MYLSSSESEIAQIKKYLNIDSVQDLFPEQVRFHDFVDYETFTEQKLLNKYSQIKNRKCFAGAGRYDMYVPPLVDSLISRGEFLTSYTPYQPEVAQGTLTAIFEFQTMISEITGLELANASLYDGANALQEAIMMGQKFYQKKQVIIAGKLHPHYQQVLATCIEQITYCSFEDSSKFLNDQVAVLVVVSPDFYGEIYDYAEVFKVAKQKGIVTISVFNPLSLAILKPPAEMFADIAVAEGQMLGNHLNFGGPGLGIIAARKDFVRFLPGRIVGLTEDENHQPCYCLTLQTREQHIRREKATSNICSNQALNALAAVIYLSMLGQEGFVQKAWEVHRLACYAVEKFSQVGLQVLNKNWFQEIALQLPVEPQKVVECLADFGLDAGVGKLTTDNVLLLAFSDKLEVADIDFLVEKMVLCLAELTE